MHGTSPSPPRFLSTVGVGLARIAGVVSIAIVTSVSVIRVRVRVRVPRRVRRKEADASTVGGVRGRIASGTGGGRQWARPAFDGSVGRDSRGLLRVLEVLGVWGVLGWEEDGLIR